MNRAWPEGTCRFQRYMYDIESRLDDCMVVDGDVIVKHDFQVCGLGDWVVPIIESRNMEEEEI